MRQLGLVLIANLTDEARRRARGKPVRNHAGQKLVAHCRLTPRHARIFAKGRCGDCGMWVTLAHSSDCRTRRSTQHNHNMVELRVLVQNLGAFFVSFRPADLCVRWLCCEGPEHGVAKGIDECHRKFIETRPAHLVNTRVFARSCTALHDRTTSATADEYIDPNEWVGIAACVECPDCNFELDFLERAKAMSLPFVERSGDFLDVSMHVVEAHFVSIEQLYRWYSILPGGYVSLAHAL